MVADASAAPAVVAYALIGWGERLLLLERPEHDILPGGAVLGGEPVERALRRSLVDQLGAVVDDVDFCAAVEHGTCGPGRLPTSEVVFLFDVTLADRDCLDGPASQPHRWAGEHDLCFLRPEPVRDALLEGCLTADNPWLAWTP
ncbi:NUDIX domain-containing protein [Amycolatopsis sp. NPDC058986]|uniref:NUDIX domain-containing protein n=1 Tax=unclassified Amycolatopsis TaxID=2618356 RepID=UPI00367117D6